MYIYMYIYISIYISNGTWLQKYSVGRGRGGATAAAASALNNRNGSSLWEQSERYNHYRGTSLIRNSVPIGPFSRTMTRTPLWS